MNKKIVLVRIAAFLLILFLLFRAATFVLCRKDSLKRFGPFLQSADHYDVWFLGNSIMVNAVLSMELWEKYGISAYNLASNGNTMPVTYWAAMNFLDYAVPKVAVIDINDVHQTYKLSGSSGDVHSALDCFPLSRGKIAAIEDLMASPNENYADNDGQYYRDFRWEYYFTLGKYHSRWNELTADDWMPDFDVGCGGKALLGVKGMVYYNLVDDPEPLPETGYGFEYLRKLVEALQSRGVQVVLVSLPSIPKESKLQLASAAENIAEDYDIPFINFLMMDSVMDYNTNLADSHGHCNLSGALKTTDYFGDYLSNHYELTDRRKDPVLIREDEAYAHLKTERFGLAKQSDRLLLLLHDSAYSSAVFVPAGSSLYGSDLSMLLLQNIGRDHVMEADDFSKWSNSEFPLSMLQTARDEGLDYLAVFDRQSGTITEYTGADALAKHDCGFGSFCFSSGKEGVSLTADSTGESKTPIRSAPASIAAMVLDRNTGNPVLTESFQK